MAKRRDLPADAVDLSAAPVYTATRSKDFPGWLLVWCPRDECGCMFLVERQPWYNQARSFRTRACPYCFKASVIPPPRSIRRAAS